MTLPALLSFMNESELTNPKNMLQQSCMVFHVHVIITAFILAELFDSCCWH